MLEDTGGITSHLLGGLFSFLRKCVFSILSAGPVPNHIAFIMDGNRRYAKKRNLPEGVGHKAGFSALKSILRYCYELGVKYATVYAFSIDNFKRKPKEVQSLMDLMQEKIEELLEQESIIHEYGVRLYFIGNLQLLTEPVRAAMEKAMRATSHNNQRVLLVCVAYTSYDEIVHAVQESCKEKRDEVLVSKRATYSNGEIAWFNKCLKRNDTDVHGQDSCKNHVNGTKACNGEKNDFYVQNGNCTEAEITCCGAAEITEESKEEPPSIQLIDIQKHMYMSVAPDPDILIRTAGEVRLSNFLLWQTSTCPLYAPAALWPEIGVRHLVWAVLNFQRHHFYLEKKKKRF